MYSANCTCRDCRLIRTGRNDPVDILADAGEDARDAALLAIARAAVQPHSAADLAETVYNALGTVGVTVA